MDMIRQYDHGIDHKWVSCTRFRDGNAESIHAIDEQCVPTLKKIDREEPAPAEHERATIIWHPCTLSIVADYAALIVLSQKVARFGFENQLFEKIQDWRTRC
jgi:hypothetical protein